MVLYISSYIDWIVDFFNNGLYEMFTSFSSYFVIKFTEASLLFIIWSVSFSWDVAKVILNDLNLSSSIQNAFNLIDNNALQIAYYLKIPEMINVILTGAMTRYVLNFIPFL